MIEFFNDFSANWFNYFVDIVIQNSIFLVLMFGILYFMQNSNVRVLRSLLLISLIKLIIPPFISTNIIEDISPLNIEAISVFPASILQSSSYNSQIQLSTESMIFLTWIIIVLTIFFITIMNTFRYLRKLRNSESIDVSEYGVLFNKSIKILRSNYYHSPFVIGIFKPKIVLPKNWDEWTMEDKKAVLLHEYAHIFEKDHWINILKVIVQAVYFFNPLIWFLNKRLHRYSEMLCDDFTIDALHSNQINYSKRLLKISEMTITLSGMGLKSLAFSESFKSIKDRINYQINKKETSFMKNLNLKSLILLLTFSAVIISFSWQCSTVKSTKVFKTTDSARIFEFEEVTIKPEMIKNVRPEYPDAARKEGLEGLAVITVTIDESGNVENMEIYKAIKDSVEYTIDENGKRSVNFIVKSNDLTLLDQSALDAAKDLKFEPAELDGQAVKVKMNVPFNFRLK